MVGFEEIQYQALENEDTAIVCIVLQGTLDFGITVDVNIGASSSASVGQDYVFLPLTIIFEQNLNPVSCHSLNLIDDGVIEDTESIFLVLSTIFSRVVTGVAETEVSIIDTTMGSIAYLSPTDIFITEGNGASLCFQSAQPLEMIIHIEVDFVFVGGMYIHSYIM